PLDANFIELLGSHGALDAVNVVAVHGFPLDWNHWSIHQWPEKIEEIRRVAQRPVWATEVGVSSFGAEEVQLFGLQLSVELIRSHADALFHAGAHGIGAALHESAEEDRGLCRIRRLGGAAVCAGSPRVKRTSRCGVMSKRILITGGAGFVGSHLADALLQRGH